MLSSMTTSATSLSASTRSPCSAAAPCARAGAVVGFDDHLARSAGEYRLLLHCVRVAGRDSENYYCVLSVGSTLPRRLTHARGPLKEAVPTWYELPVYYRGTLHWLEGYPQGRTTGKMLAFDTASETFRLMSRPPPAAAAACQEEPAAPATTDLYLIELGEELSVATIYIDVYGATTLDVWALQDYEAENWTLGHRLKVQPPPPWSLVDDWKRCIVMGDALICGSRSTAMLIGFPHVGAAMVYSLKDNKVQREINFGGNFSFNVFGESLVPHAFFNSSDRCPESVPLNFSYPYLLMK